MIPKNRFGAGRKDLEIHLLQPFMGKLWVAGLELGFLHLMLSRTQGLEEKSFLDSWGVRSRDRTLIQMKLMFSKAKGNVHWFRHPGQLHRPTGNPGSPNGLCLVIRPQSTEIWQGAQDSFEPSLKEWPC